MCTLRYAAVTALLALLIFPRTVQGQPAYAVALHAPVPIQYGGFGNQVVGLEDVDGDGRGDFAVAELSTENVYVYSGATLQRLYTIAFYQPSSLNGTPDFDGDGIGELLINTYLYSGATGALLHSYSAPGLNTPGASTVVPDADGDGGFDVAIAEAASGAPQAVFLVSGASGDLLHTLANPAPTSDCDLFGATLVGVSDVDGDGRGDLAVGDPGAPCLEGRVHLFSGASGAYIRSLGQHESYMYPHGFGTGLYAFTDVDGDGHGDLLITGTATNVESGRAYVFSGATGERLQFHRHPSFIADYDFYGASVAVLPDVTGDGAEDFVVGAPGLRGDPQIHGDAFLYGASGDLVAHLEPRFPERDGGFGRPLAGVPDIDGDGLGEILVGARLEDVSGTVNAGRVYLFLSREAPLPLVEVVPVDLPIVIPAEGGAFSFTVALGNQSNIFQRWDVWGRAYLDGTAVGAPLGPFTVHVDPGQDTTFVFEQPVPAGAPPGDYTYSVSLGRHPDPLAGESSFPFSKAQPTASASGPNAAALTLSASPNPALGRATLAFTLPAHGATRLALFDALGREVAVLLDGVHGAGVHEAQFDASSLAMGVYVARLEVGGSVITRRIVVAQ